MENKEVINNLAKSIIPILENGDRLLEDAQYLLEYGRPPTAYALCILAQEEYAKAFILYLISEGAIPWTKEVKGVLHDHTCKQLISKIIDFLRPEDFYKWLNKRSNENYKMPSYITDAINIIRHEKAPKRGQWSWLEDDEPPCDKLARKVANGHIDRQKQDAIYVRIGKSGKVASTPFRIPEERVNELFEETERLSNFLIRTDGELKPLESVDFRKIFWTFKLHFGLCTIEEYEKCWWT